MVVINQIECKWICEIGVTIAGQLVVNEMWQQSEWPYHIKVVPLTWIVLVDLSMAYYKKTPTTINQASF